MIYVITKGDYSDYHIVAATVSKDTAQKMAKRYDAEIEEYEDAVIIPDKSIWLVRVSDNGCKAYENDGDYAIPDAMSGKIYPNSKLGFVTLWVFADDEEHAKKIACDKYAQWKYNQPIGKVYGRVF